MIDRNSMILRLIPIAFSFLLLSACHIENFSGDGMADFKHGPRQAVCGSFCNHLYTCGNVGPQQYGECVSKCEAKFDSAETKTREGCECVVQAKCQAVEDYGCKGAPLPTTDAGLPPRTQPALETGSSADAGATPDSGAKADSSAKIDAKVAQTSGYTCETGSDCAWSEDCVSGQCLVRCKASCDCHAAESCTGGYCSVPAPSPVAQACLSDCDCPVGALCTAGFCK